MKLCFYTDAALAEMALYLQRINDTTRLRSVRDEIKNRATRNRNQDLTEING